MKKNLLILGVSLLIAACQPSEKAKADSALHLQIAREYLAAGSTDSALAETEAALKANRHNAEAAFLKADILGNSGKHDEAAAIVEKTAEDLPEGEEFKADYWRGVLSLHRGEPDKAVEHLLKAEAANPRFLDLYQILGQAYARKGDAAKAADAHERWVAAEPENSRAWDQLGFSCIGARRLDRAKEALEKSLALNPKNGLAYNYLGVLAQERHESAEAEKNFLKSIELDPSNPFASLNLGQLLMMAGRYKEALPHLENTLKLQPNNQYALYYVGKYHLTGGDASKAADYFEMAAAKDPSLWLARIGVTEAALKSKGMYDRAQKTLEEGLVKDPANQKGYYYDLSRLRLAQGDGDGALQYMDKAAALLGKDDVLALADSHLMRGKIFDAINRRADAKREYQTAVKTAPGSPIAKEAGKLLGRH